MLNVMIMIRNTLYRCLLFGFLYYLFINLFYLFGENFLLNFMKSVYKINEQDTRLLMVYFIGTIEVILILFGLAPALALHWTIKKLEKGQK